MPALVSVIIPNYNTGRFLPEALESVFAQTYQNYEIIVVDDGSTDETKQFLQPYMNRIHYIYQENLGVSAARNHALKFANGEWILFLDADDKIIPKKLERQLAIATPEMAIIHSAWWLIDENGEIIGEEKPYQQIPELNLENFLFWKPIFPAALLFRREWLDKVGGFDTSLSHAEDVDLVLQILTAGGKAIWLEETTAYYRQREGSASTKSLAQAQSIERVLDKVFALPHLPKRIKSIETSVRYYSMLWYTWRLLDDGYLEEAKTNLLKAQALRQRPAEYLLLEWQAQYHRDANEFFAECLELAEASEILSAKYENFSPERQIELAYAYIATRKTLSLNLEDFTQNLSPAGKLASYLSFSAKAAKRKQWQLFFQNLPHLLRWTLIPDAPKIYFSLLRRLKNEI